MNENIVNMIWVGEKISPIEALCMKSFIKNGMQVRLHTYHSIEGVPQEVELCNASLILPESEVFTYKGSYAIFADLFRWKLMVEQAGYYADTDVICLQAFDFKQEVVVGWESDNQSLANTIIGFKNTVHVLAKQMLDNALYPLSVRPYDSLKMKRKKFLKGLLPFKVRTVGWGENAGPKGLTKEFFLKEDHYNITPKNQETFYKIPYSEWERFIRPYDINFNELRETSYAAHLWNEMWRRNGIDKYKPFAKNSFLYQAFEYYM